ncbi:TRAP transporter substrate-binding protein [Mesobacillus selenatarsenatis]|uniref:TRAP transporter substrate-binding protein n=1 Tax=Mesobacillus selenatarsenatis TaxID=388741 RepID=A0A846TJX4_9BACI|nr:TRAP transporter substrate-binding protein [Mesobacillus selenatarsenatis]NKE07069.1 TRAP transporter substrate-binding protein [Mesobacillus selenatarsenatis]
MKSINKKLAGFYVLIALTLILGGCGSSAGSGSAEEALTIDISIFHTENDPFNDIFKEWSETIEKETDGRVKFKPYYSASLVSLFETLDAVRDGSVEAGILSAGAISGQIPEMGLLETIGTFSSEDQYKNIYKDVTPELESLFSNHNVEILMWAPGATETLVLHQKDFITDLGQYKNLSMRTAGRWQGEQAKLLGALPITMDPSELYLALQNGTVQSTFQTVGLTNSQNLHEVTPKMTALGLSINTIQYVVNPDVWSKISEKDQKTIKKISDQVGQSSYSMLKKREKEALKSMAEKGAEFYHLTDDEREELLKVIQPVNDQIAKESEKAKSILEVIDKHE